MHVHAQKCVEKAPNNTRWPWSKIDILVWGGCIIAGLKIHPRPNPRTWKWDLIWEKGLCSILSAHTYGQHPATWPSCMAFWEMWSLLQETMDSAKHQGSVFLGLGGLCAEGFQAIAFPSHDSSKLRPVDASPYKKQGLADERQTGFVASARNSPSLKSFK